MSQQTRPISARITFLEKQEEIVNNKCYHNACSLSAYFVKFAVLLDCSITTDARGCSNGILGCRLAVLQLTHATVFLSMMNLEMLPQLRGATATGHRNLALAQQTLRATFRVIKKSFLSFKRTQEGSRRRLFITAACWPSESPLSDNTISGVKSIEHTNASTRESCTVTALMTSHANLRKIRYREVSIL